MNHERGANMLCLTVYSAGFNLSTKRLMLRFPELPHRTIKVQLKKLITQG
jgi:hypothetical protein